MYLTVVQDFKNVNSSFVFCSSQHSILDTYPWDIFKEYAYDTELYSLEWCIVLGTKLLKFFFCFFSCAIILASSVISKLTLLFATSNLNPYVKFQNDLDYTNAIRENRCGVPTCVEKPYDSREMIRWMWCVTLCVCTPYILGFVQCMWKILFRQKKKPARRALGWVS